MPLSSLVRSVVPPNIRAIMRRNAVVNRYLAWRYGGEQCRPHPKTSYTFCFDGYRNIGWAMGGLADCETHELDYACDLIRKSGARCVWDVGANVGLWSLFLASLTPPVERVVCFEPDPYNLRFLRRNCELNALSGRMTVRDVALSSEAGQATFFADAVTGKTGSLEEGSDFIGQYYGAKRSPITVTLTTIDLEVENGAPPPDFMKVDVEGHELDLLKGARRTLESRHPALIMEVTRNAEEVNRFLRDLGYNLYDPATGVPMDRPQFATAAIYGR